MLALITRINCLITFRYALYSLVCMVLNKADNGEIRAFTSSDTTASVGLT